MNEDATTIEMEEEDAPILPDGWHEGMDIFAEDAPPLDDERTDESDTVKESESDNIFDETEDGDPLTMGATPDAEEPSADAPESEDSADGRMTLEERAPRILKLKVNHNEEELNLDETSDDDLIAMAQKARAFDAMKEDQLKEKYRQTYNDQIYAGMTEDAARMVAEYACGGKSYSLEDEPEEVEEFHEEQTRETTDRDFRSQLKQLQSLFPNVQEMPTKVMDAYMNGADLVTAYSAYNAQQTAQAAAEIKKENAILKHNAASAAKAPVRGVTSGGSPKDKPEDPFLRGLKDEYW